MTGGISYKDGVFTMPHPSKVEIAYAIYYEWLHERAFEFHEDCHPSWIGYTERQSCRIFGIIKTMTQEEKKSFFDKIKT